MEDARQDWPIQRMDIQKMWKIFMAQQINCMHMQDKFKRKVKLQLKLRHKIMISELISNTLQGQKENLYFKEKDSYLFD